jgi:hypothetical protein
MTAQNFVKTKNLSLYLSHMLLELVGTLEHDLFLCPLVTHFGFCSWRRDLEKRLAPLSLFVPSLSPWLGALFNGSIIKKSFPKVRHQAS